MSYTKYRAENRTIRNLEEAKWFEEEICKISAIVFVDCVSDWSNEMCLSSIYFYQPPEVAEKRTQQRARKAVQGGHKLFQRSTETLIAQFREQGMCHSTESVAS